MNGEKITVLVKGIVENEFNHIQANLEKDFIDNNIEQKELTKATQEIFNELRCSLSKEQEELLFDLEFAITDEWTRLCEFYFKKGLRAGLVNLKFLNEIDFIGSILYT